MSASKILIVDDELSIRIMLSRMIEPLQHEVYTAENGEVALGLVRELGVDLVISDLMMPRMDGLTLLENVRRDGSDCAFIILTGYGDLPQALAAREQFNIANFLVKPIHNMDQFLFDVESALSRRLLERENARLLQRLKNVNAELEGKVRERTSELERKNQELDRVSRFRADALKVLGHELRTPLAILSGYYALAGGDTEEFSALAPAMGSSLERLQEIVDRALQWLKATEATEFPLELTRLSVFDMCIAVADRIRPLVASRDIVIATPTRSGLGGGCVWDRERMEGVVEELLINAVRASEDGTAITIALDCGEAEITLEVRDQGVGVPAGQHVRIFEPFVTLREAQNHSSGVLEYGAEGVGIGLSTARMWVLLHGGEIEAVPNGSGPGTTVRIRMPRDANWQPEERAERSPGTEAASTGPPAA